MKEIHALHADHHIQDKARGYPYLVWCEKEVWLRHGAGLLTETTDGIAAQKNYGSKKKFKKKNQREKKNPKWKKQTREKETSSKKMILHYFLNYVKREIAIIQYEERL